jgi:type IV pilus assembly protein PilV
MNPIDSRALSAQSGFTMLEVLISIVVIAFGMLGVAGLQAFALKNSQSASYRSVATVLATDIIDRIRANPVGATNNFYVTASGQQGSEAEAASCLTSSGCASAEALAGHDLFEWHLLVSRSLPNGVGVVCRDSTPADGQPGAPGCDGAGAFVVKIWWLDERNRQASSAVGERFRFSTEFQI